MFKKLNNQETYRSLFPMAASPLLEQLKYVTTAKVEAVSCTCDNKCDCVDIKETIANFTITMEPVETEPLTETKDAENCNCEECNY